MQPHFAKHRIQLIIEKQNKLLLQQRRILPCGKIAFGLTLKLRNRAVDIPPSAEKSRKAELLPRNEQRLLP